MMIFSQTGQKLTESGLNSGYNEFDMNAMASGLYIISLRDDSGIYKTQKIAKF